MMTIIGHHLSYQSSWFFLLVQISWRLSSSSATSNTTQDQIEEESTYFQYREHSDPAQTRQRYLQISIEIFYVNEGA